MNELQHRSEGNRGTRRRRRAVDIEGNEFTSQVRTSFAEAVQRVVTPEQWKSILHDPETRRGVKTVADHSHIMPPLAEDIREHITNQFEASWQFSPEAEVFSKELYDVLEVTGLNEILLWLVTSVHVGMYDRANDALGMYDPRKGSIYLFIEPNSRERLIPTLVHEAGHAIEQTLASEVDGQELYDGYVAATLVERQAYSSYAAAFRIHGDERNFVSESFAEDVRALFLAPDLVAPHKRAAIARILRRVLPSYVDVEITSRKIRSMLGNYYGKDISSDLQPTHCEHAKEFARDFAAAEVEMRNAKEREAAERAAQLQSALRRETFELIPPAPIDWTGDDLNDRPRTQS